MRTRSTVLLACALLVVSATVYLLVWALFGRGTDVLFYLLHALGLMPLQVLVLTLIVDRLLAAREKRALLKKLNMVIGAFFSEVGTGLLRSISAFDGRSGDLRPALQMSLGWSREGFSVALEAIRRHRPKLEPSAEDIVRLKRDLVGGRDFMLRLLENPNLLEHESFTDALWAVFHLTEELAARLDLRSLTRADLEHLEGDMERAYLRLLAEWVRYMRHLASDYPYLFSLSVRTNPFDAEARAELE